MIHAPTPTAAMRTRQLERHPAEGRRAGCHDDEHEWCDGDDAGRVAHPPRREGQSELARGHGTGGGERGRSARRADEHAQKTRSEHEPEHVDGPSEGRGEPNASQDRGAEQWGQCVAHRDAEGDFHGCAVHEVCGHGAHPHTRPQPPPPQDKRGQGDPGGRPHGGHALVGERQTEAEARREHVGDGEGGRSPQRGRDPAPAGHQRVRGHAERRHGRQRLYMPDIRSHLSHPRRDRDGQRCLHRAGAVAVVWVIPGAASLRSQAPSDEPGSRAARRQSPHPRPRT